MVVQPAFRLKRREILLLLISLSLVFFVYRSNQSLTPYSMVFGAFGSIGVYFAYRALFQQRYIGIVAAALVVFSPWYYAESFLSEKQAAGVFFAATAVWAWGERRWLPWGLAFGLALASHPATQVLAPPFAAHAIIRRRSIPPPRGLILGALAAALMVAAALGWFWGSYGRLDEWVSIDTLAGWREAFDSPRLLRASQPPLLLSIGVYVAVVGTFAYAFRARPRVFTLGVAALAVALPYIVLLAINFQPILAVGGPLLWVLALIAIPALWKVDPEHDQIVFLLLWLAPSLIILRVLGLADPTYYVFLIPALAILACRLLERTLDGQWLDFWWAAGLPTSLYYRLGKIVALGVLLYSMSQALGS